MKIYFENEILEYLSLPSVPAKKWDGEKSFKDGVAIVEMHSERLAYAVATFDKETDEQPRIKKTFAPEPFYSIKDIFVVPSYMDTKDIDNMDLDKESKEAAQRLADEAKALEEQGTESEKMKEMKTLPEWVFENIHNLEEARAFISSFNSKNKIKTKIPKNEETVKLRLLTIYNEMENKSK